MEENRFAVGGTDVCFGLKRIEKKVKPFPLSSIKFASPRPSGLGPKEVESLHSALNLEPGTALRFSPCG